MKDYERLTLCDDHYKVYDEKIIEDGDYFMFPQTRESVCDKLNRLVWLENKIERGEIDYVVEKDDEIARLKVENQRLQKEVDYWINW